MRRQIQFRAFQKLPPKVRMSIFVLLGCAVVGGSFAYIGGQFMDRAERELQNLTGNADSLQEDINRIEEDIRFIKANLERFENIRARQMLEPHDRLTAIRAIEILQAVNGLNTVSYEFQPAQIFQANGNGNETIVVAESDVLLSIASMLDRHLFYFMYYLEQAFPGAALITDFQIERADTIDEAALRTIANGETVDLVSGSIRFTWRSVVEQNP